LADYAVAQRVLSSLLDVSGRKSFLNEVVSSVMLACLEGLPGPVLQQVLREHEELRNMLLCLPAEATPEVCWACFSHLSWGIAYELSEPHVGQYTYASHDSCTPFTEWKVCLLFNGLKIMSVAYCGTGTAARSAHVATHASGGAA
jgi:hypothetical protein